MDFSAVTQVNQAYQAVVAEKLSSVPSPKAMFQEILAEKLGAGTEEQTAAVTPATSSDDLWTQQYYNALFDGGSVYGNSLYGTSLDSILWNTDGKATDYDSIIARASQQYGLSPALIKSVIQTESSFNESAVSSAGAIGLMQLMPSTASGLGVNNPYDPEQNIMGGVKYLSSMLRNFNGDIRLALAGYNMGGNRVKNLGITPNSTDLSAYNALPSGVLAYVNKVLSGMN